MQIRRQHVVPTQLGDDPHGRRHQEADGKHDGGNGQVLPEQNVPPRDGAEDEDAEAVAVEAKHVSNQLRHEHHHQTHHAVDHEWSEFRLAYVFSHGEEGAAKHHQHDERRQEEHLGLRRPHQGPECSQGHDRGIFRHPGQLPFQKARTRIENFRRERLARVHIVSAPTSALHVDSHCRTIRSHQRHRTNQGQAADAEQRHEHVSFRQVLRSHCYPSRRDDPAHQAHDSIETVQKLLLPRIRLVPFLLQLHSMTLDFLFIGQLGLFFLFLLVRSSDFRWHNGGSHSWFVGDLPTA